MKIQDNVDKIINFILTWMSLSQCLVKKIFSSLMKYVKEGQYQTKASDQQYQSSSLES